MKITKINLVYLRNDEYFQFHTEFKDLTVKHGAEALKIETQFADYLPLYEKVDEGIKKNVKSIFTAELQDADKARDDIWSGMFNAHRRVDIQYYQRPPRRPEISGGRLNSPPEVTFSRPYRGGGLRGVDKNERRVAEAF